MSSVTLDRDSSGTYILSCRCGNIEIGRGERRWQAFEIAPQANDLAEVTCLQCHARARLHHAVPADMGAAT
ncbi:hypothetical protein [Halomonas sp. 3H]|uniref:hypothetical protein n=1 Tax=Halomonas sp. 3H TaxID=2952527 RepID=UPI0020B7D36F|nr:hypothetical protein [Halomonas sp. 3H]